ncbi:MAG: VWA domain-containing protein, partial [Selenomonadaceae bacterium]|nr:VWA domain-containing protein [Selenomonadaceae bacterium]
ICILDRSGSMKNLAGDTIGGYNSFIEKQRKEEGSAEVTTVLFDDQYDKIVDAMDLQDVPELTSKEYYARGMTALLDAVGRTIMDTAGRMEKEGICPEKRRVIFFIMTDGQENDSKEYDRASVKAMIETATKEYNWNFIFMGANIDSVSEAASIGIDSKHAVDYDYNGAGIRQSFDRMDAAVSEMRETGTVGDQWKDK